MSGSTTLSDSYTKNRYHNDNWQSGTGSTDATFNSPQGKMILDSLTGSATSGKNQGYVDEAGRQFSQYAKGGMNPYTEQAISASNAEAGKMMNEGLAQLRSQNYRGGTAANLYGQGRYASDLASQLNMANQNTRMNAYESGQDRGLQATQGLGGLGTTGQGLAGQLLALLRGETSDQFTKGQSSGKSSTRALAGQQSFSYAM